MNATAESRPQPGPVTSPQRFGTFQGVFRPTVLTVLGAMLYLREGWLVGNAGLLGALLVIGAAYLITGTTAWSVSSLATNTRVRPGGAFAIIAQALGLEAGGAIGIPLFVAQAASSAMYLFAFSEAWAVMFPDHPTAAVVGAAFVAMAALTWISASLAFRAQAVMLGVVVVALLSAFSGWTTNPLQRPQWIGAFPEASLLECFAIFFPAATGVTVGVGMSGSLADPRRSIPTGTLWAWGVTLVVYVLAAFWYATVGTPEELVSERTFMVHHALVGPLVLFGLLASTLMAALSNLVTAPRLLQAMAQHDVVPGARWLARESDGGEPRNATALTLAVAGLALLSGSLDAVAPIITSFFVVTYLAINAVVFLEHRLKMISFRPTLPIPPWVPLLGLASCTLALAGTSGGVLEIGFVVGIFFWLSGRRLETPWETVRSGIGVTVAAWAARRFGHIRRSERAWKPDLLVPIASADEIDALLPVVTSVAGRNGSVKLVGVGPDDALTRHLDELAARLSRAHVYSTSTALHADSFARGAQVAIDAMQGAFFPPNLVAVDAHGRSEEELQGIVDHCRAAQVGMMLWFGGPDGPLGPAPTVDVWISDRSPDWALQLHIANLDLPVLLGYLLVRNGGGRMRLLTCLRDPAEAGAARRFLARLVDMGRLPHGTGTEVLTGPFLDAVRDGPEADVHLFGLSADVDLDRMRAIHAATGAACLFLLDSGHESLLA